MTEFKDVLKSAVLKYITSNSGNVDYVDVLTHFKLHDALLAAGKLVEDGVVKRVWNGRYYLLEAVK